MTKQDLARKAANRAGISITAANDVIDAAIDAITDSLKSGESVKLPRFGTFEMKHRNARTGRNPHTGEPVPIPARDIPSWVPSGYMMALCEKREGA